MKKNKKQVMGRVSKSDVLFGRAEYTKIAGIGDFMYYHDGNSKVICQVTGLQQTSFRGLTGTFRILGKVLNPPAVYTELYLFTVAESGILNIGLDRRDNPVNLRLNPFFRHVLIAGKTGEGKTHLGIILAEEFIKHNVPHIVLDIQGEFANLSNAIIVENIRIEDLLGYMRQRKTVVLNLLGLNDVTKAHIIYDVLLGLRDKKEEDYKNAEGDMNLLTIPPILVTLDEAEVFASSNYTTVVDRKCRDILVDVAKRGSKFGIGLIALAQRPPFLHIDVRSQCNSAIIFLLDDKGSYQVVSQLGYINRFDMDLVHKFERGDCLVTGVLIRYPTLVKTRDINTKRAKLVDFAQMLDIKENVAYRPIYQPELNEELPPQGESLTTEPTKWQAKERELWLKSPEIQKILDR